METRTDLRGRQTLAESATTPVPSNPKPKVVKTLSKRPRPSLPFLPFESEHDDDHEGQAVERSNEEAKDEAGEVQEIESEDDDHQYDEEINQDQDT